MHKNPFTCIISSHAMFICAYIIKYVGASTVRMYLRSCLQKVIWDEERQ